MMERHMKRGGVRQKNQWDRVTAGQKKAPMSLKQKHKICLAWRATIRPWRSPCPTPMNHRIFDSSIGC